MKALPHPENLHLDAAVGWLMLGDPASALHELAKLSTASRDEPEVLELEWSACSKAGRWLEGLRVAERMLVVMPDSPSGWISRAYATRRMPGGGLPQAWEALHPAAAKFPAVELIPFNLACYAAQMGRAEEAWTWLERAGAAGGDRAKIKQMALADPDLQPLWPKLRELPPADTTAAGAGPA